MCHAARDWKRSLWSRQPDRSGSPAPVDDCVSAQLSLRDLPQDVAACSFSLEPRFQTIRHPARRTSVQPRRNNDLNIKRMS